MTNIVDLQNLLGISDSGDDLRGLPEMLDRSDPCDSAACARPGNDGNGFHSVLVGRGGWGKSPIIVGTGGDSE
ncbi:hypothetical protein BKG82_12710 [Mycobacteroides chelonae]|uniref:Uncharacterized protein n=1 Tax=Mycobacteroides chelonae TaxID=1774 RepID=A0A1S1LTN7_MYCCH|nr:hypothetical protein BKG82_12710 [Mycobacteroides chelonae]